MHIPIMLVTNDKKNTHIIQHTHSYCVSSDSTAIEQEAWRQPVWPRLTSKEEPWQIFHMSTPSEAHTQNRLTAKA